MSRHTPGPWHWVDQGFESDLLPKLCDSAGAEICNFGDRTLYQQKPGESPNDPDKNLIAAAPELLEALENLENDAGQIPEHAWKIVKAAIARAKGEQV